MLYSAPMVSAILDDTKTQTRRLAKGVAAIHTVTGEPLAKLDSAGPRVSCPYGQTGDLLWVRETFYAWGRWETRYCTKKGHDEWHFIDMTLKCGKAYLYAATDKSPQPMGGKRHKGSATPTWWKRPSIFMPRAASRITLEIIRARVERLNNITEADALAEGCTSTAIPNDAGDDYIGHYASEEYQALWESLNGHGSWSLNPWVWVIEFKHLETT